jgi:tetratricopeptide (TPR) repeat protein
MPKQSKGGEAMRGSDWDKMRKAGDRDPFFRQMGSLVLAKLVEATGVSASEISRKLVTDDEDLIGKFIRKERVPEGAFLEKLAPILADLLSGRHHPYSAQSAHSLEIDLSLSYGLLPRQLIGLSGKNRELLIFAISNLIAAVYEASKDPLQDIGNSKHWIEKLGVQNRAWRALIDFTQKWRYATEWHEIETLWEHVQRDWELMQAEQRGWAAILRAQTLKLRGLTHDALALLEFARDQFPEEFGEPQISSTRIIRFHLFSTWGDAYRELGQLDKALHAYGKADSYASTPIEHFRLARKQFDSYIRVSDQPKHELMQVLTQAATNKVFNLNGVQGQLGDPAEYAHTCFALAWYLRMKGADTIAEAKNYLNKALDALNEAEGTSQIEHVKAIGYQYFADTLIRGGDFGGARDALSQSDFLPLHHARRAYSGFLAGRAHAYQAWKDNDIDSINSAISSLEAAERLYSMMGTSPRRAQTLIELAKFYSIRPTFAGGEKYENDFEEAKSHLDLAETILKSLGTFRQDTWPAIQINREILEFMKFVAIGKADRRYSQVAARIQAITDLNKELKNAFIGHQARGYALSVAWQCASRSFADGAQAVKQDKVLREARQAADAASKRDEMTIIDCQRIIELGIDLLPDRDEWYSKVQKEFVDSLR